MSLTKSDIVTNIAFGTSISRETSKQLFEHFVKIVLLNSQNKSVKITKFGTFSYQTSPERIGRNPKSGEEYIISRRSKVKFSPSNSIKKVIN